MSRKEGFLDRWSRMKQADDLPPEEPAVEPPAPEEPLEDERSDEEILEELGLVDPDELKPGDDFSGFMAKAVPDRLRRRALRQLWRSNPVLANVDGLVEYGEDYTDSAMVVENLQTLYQVGKGMFVEQPEAEPSEADDEAEAAVQTNNEDADRSPEDAANIEDVDTDRDEPQARSSDEETITSDEADAPLQPLATRRRMQFS